MSDERDEPQGDWEASDDDLDAEGPQSVDLEDLGDEEDSPTAQCPYCRAEIYEDAQRCDRCGQYIVPGAAPSKASWLLAIVAALAAAGLLVWLTR